MKKFVAVLGLGLLACPLLRQLFFWRSLDGSDSPDELTASLFGLYGGLMAGFAGLVILGFLMDGGSGYRKPTLLIMMAMLGGLWFVFYPGGRLLGIALVAYPVSHRFGFAARTGQKKE